MDYPWIYPSFLGWSNPSLMVQSFLDGPILPGWSNPSWMVQTSAFGLLVDQILAAWRPPGFDPLTVGLRPPCVSNPGGLEAARI